MNENEIARRLLALLRSQPQVRLDNLIEDDERTVETTRIKQFRHYRDDEQVKKKSILSLLIYKEPSILSLVLYTQTVQQPLFAYLSILYETVQENDPTPCVCSTYNRQGNKCYPVCDGTGTYATLEACLAAPEPPWPNPAGEDGGGGYWVLYAGYKQSSAYIGNGYEYPSGSWSGGIWYQAANHFCGTALDYVSHYAPATDVLANPGEFPDEDLATQYWYYYSLPMIPDLDASAYPAGAVLVGMKNAITTTAVYKSDANGWFAVGFYNTDIYLQATESWYSGDGMAYALCFVGKYVPYSNFGSNGEIPPSPPSSIDGFNVSGVSLISNLAAIQCGEFGTDDECVDPGLGEPPVGCPYPREKRSRTFWIGGSKQTPVEIRKLNYSDRYYAYLVAIGGQLTGVVPNQNIVSNELVRIVAGNEPGSTYFAYSEWCKIIDISVNGNTVTENLFSSPAIPSNPLDWKQSLLGYQVYFPGSPPSSNKAYIDSNRSAFNINIETYTNEETELNTHFKVEFDHNQKVPIAENENAFDKFIDLIETQNVINEARLCISKFQGETASTEQHRGFIVDKVFQIPANANILAYSGYVSEIQKAHADSTINCVALRSIVYCATGWDDTTPVCEAGQGKLLRAIQYEDIAYTITVEFGADFAVAGDIQVLKSNSGYSPLTSNLLTYKKTLPNSGGSFQHNFNNGDLLSFRVKNPTPREVPERDEQGIPTGNAVTIVNFWDTACISWNDDTQIVKLEGF